MPDPRPATAGLQAPNDATRPAPEAFHIEAPGRNLFALLRRPAGPCRGAILHVPAFAEEMNKSRRMVRMASTELVAAGYAVMLFDLHGCGDSSGDFHEARWDGWVDDVDRAASELATRVDAPLCLWGLRAGCLLAAQAAARRGDVGRYLFWQPSGSGRQVLQQFLRLKLAASMEGGGPRETLEQMRSRLAAGECIDVAGYSLPPAVAEGLERSALTPPPAPSRVDWLELSTRPEPELLAASRPVVAGWQEAGHEVTTAVVPGPSFWQTVWLEDAPALIDATVAALGAKSS